MLKTDRQLQTLDEIKERISLIRKNRDALDSAPLKDNHISTFKSRHEKCKKLTDRESALLLRLKELTNKGV